MDMTKGNVERWYSMNEVCIRDEMISRQIEVCRKIGIRNPDSTVMMKKNLEKW